jgi:hypothetical protein
VNTNPLAGEVTVPAMFESVLVPFAGKLAGEKKVPPAGTANPRLPHGNSDR